MRKRHVKYSAYRYKAMYERVKQEMKASSRKYQYEKKCLQYELDRCMEDYKPHYDEYIRLEVEKVVALYW
jgi:hypothetical protein